MLFYFVIPSILAAQQDRVKFELRAVGFPSSHSFQVDLRLKYVALDLRGMAEESRSLPTKKDRLMEEVSSNKFSWTITFDEKGAAKYKGSPQKCEFVFKRPIREFSNAYASLRPEGAMKGFIDGKAFGESPFRHVKPFAAGATYVLLLKNETTTNGKQRTMVYFVSKEEAQDILDDKPLKNEMKGIPVPIKK